MQSNYNPEVKDPNTSSLPLKSPLSNELFIATNRCLPDALISIMKSYMETGPDDATLNAVESDLSHIMLHPLVEWKNTTVIINRLKLSATDLSYSYLEGIIFRDSPFGLKGVCYDSNYKHMEDNRLYDEIEYYPPLGPHAVMPDFTYQKISMKPYRFTREGHYPDVWHAAWYDGCRYDQAYIFENKLQKQMKRWDKCEAYIKLDYAFLLGAKFETMYCRFFSFRQAHLVSASFKNSLLSWSTFEAANLTEANLEGTDCFKTNFFKAILRNAALQGAFLQGANFKDADLTGANLMNATFDVNQFTTQQLESLYYSNVDTRHYIQAICSYMQNNNKLLHPMEFKRAEYLISSLIHSFDPPQQNTLLMVFLKTGRLTDELEQEFFSLPSSINKSLSFFLPSESKPTSLRSLLQNVYEKIEKKQMRVSLQEEKSEVSISTPDNFTQLIEDALNTTLSLR